MHGRTQGLCRWLSRLRRPFYPSEFPSRLPYLWLARKIEDLPAGTSFRPPAAFYLEDQSFFLGPKRASNRLLQIVVDHFPETEREVCSDVNGGDDLQDRQLGNGCQSVGRQGESCRPSPGSFQYDVLEVVFDELADARTAVDVRNDLEQEVRLVESRLDVRQLGLTVFVAHCA